ncbi:hypothetical protein ACTMU2_27645 [Cupriavidus basilensis]
MQSLLDALCLPSPPPLARNTESRVWSSRRSAKFTGFVFKIQAKGGSAPPRPHCLRARVFRAFRARHGSCCMCRRGNTVAINNAITFMAQDRNTTEEAYAGDIIGVPNHGGTIRLGDVFSRGRAAGSSRAFRRSRPSSSAVRG